MVRQRHRDAGAILACRAVNQNGAARFRRMMVTLGLSVLLLIPAAAFYLVLQLR